jgi:hypothetical protein
MKHECIPLDSRSAWTSALVGIPHAFAHTWENCRAMQLTTGLPTYLYCFEDSSARIVCPITEREWEGAVDICTPYGFSGFVGTADCPAFPAYWREFVQGRGYVAGYISLSPVFENASYYDLPEVYSNNSLYLLDLTAGMDSLIAKLDRNRRRQLLGSGGAARVIEDKHQLTPFLAAHHREFMQRLGASPASFFSRATLDFLCGLPNVFAAGSGEGGEVQVVNVFSYTPYAADSLINVALPEGRSHTTRLLWYAVEKLKAMGVPVLNLGGGLSENDSIAEHKRRYGATPRPFRCLKQIYRPAVYDEMCRRAGVNWEDRTGYFPAYRKPQSVESRNVR